MNLYLQMSNDCPKLSAEDLFLHNVEIVKHETVNGRTCQAFGCVLIIDHDSDLAQSVSSCNDYDVNGVTYEEFNGVARMISNYDITSVEFSEYNDDIIYGKATIHKIYVNGSEHYNSPLDYIKSFSFNADKLIAMIQDGNLGYVIGYLDGRHELSYRNGLGFGNIWGKVFKREFHAAFSFEQRLELVADYG